MNIETFDEFRAFEFLHLLLVFIYLSSVSVVLVLFILYLCVSGTVNVLESVHIWHECIFNILKTIYSNFEKHFRMLRYVEKPKTLKGETLISCDVIFRFSC